MDTNNNIQKAKNVPPFVRYCSAIIPTMFDDSLSYYEALCALNNFLQTNVIDTINNNASVTEEYISLTNELKEFVENYFDNLDVQEEINNKLDAMVIDGTLANLINNDVFAEVLASINGVSDECDAKISSLQDYIDNTFASYESGKPTVVSSTSQMTDVNDIYLLTSDMELYAWNGSAYASLGSYIASGINANSITTEEIKQIDSCKLTNNDFYVEKILAGDTLGTSLDGKVITYSAPQGTVISSSDRCGFDILMPITEEMATRTGFAILLDVTGFTGNMYAQLPQVSYHNVTLYKSGTAVMMQLYNNASLTTYLNGHKGGFLKVRFEFQNTEGVSAVVSIHYAGSYKAQHYNDLGEFVGSAPSIQSANNILVPTDYDGSKFTFSFTSTAGISYQYDNFDPTKPLYITAPKISGNEVKTFLVLSHSDGTKYIRKDATNGIYTYNPSDWSDISSITKCTINFATNDSSATSGNPFTSTIKVPIITQAPYAGGYETTLSQIKASINESNLYGKTMLVYGDSTAKGHTLDRADVWDTLIANRNSMTLTNMAQNGKFITRNQFVDGVVTPYTQADLDNETVSNIAVVDNVNNSLYTSDYIVVSAGTNDMRQNITLGEFGDDGYVTFYGALNKTIKALLDNNPTKNILFIAPSARTTNYVHDRGYINAMKEMCEYYDVAFFDSNKLGICISNTAQRTALMLDNTHLNEAGQLKASYRYESELMTL